jgi:uncharacterized protein YkwD|tara:strand:+ start:2191 stop:3201 length:1011 start_codon:yes stop_codon:yes gene_type:complete
MTEILENILDTLNNQEYVDILLYLFIFYFLYFGWKNGSIMVIFYISSLLVAIFSSFRYSDQVGEYISNWLNSGRQLSELFAGVIIFVGIITISSLIQNIILSIKGKNDTGSKLLGSLLSILLSNLILTFVFTIITLINTTPVVEDYLERSELVLFYTDADGTPQQALEVIIGNDLLKVVSRIKDLTGKSSVVVDEYGCLEIPKVSRSKLVSRSVESSEMFEIINIARINENVDPIEFSQSLSNIANSYAFLMYEEGFWCHKNPLNGQQVGDRLSEVGQPYKTVAENLAISSTLVSGHESLMSSETHRNTILDRQFKRVGVGIVSGPLGLIIVQIFQ